MSVTTFTACFLCKETKATRPVFDRQVCNDCLEKYAPGIIARARESAPYQRPALTPYGALEPRKEQ